MDIQKRLFYIVYLPTLFFFKSRIFPFTLKSYLRNWKSLDASFLKSALLKVALIGLALMVLMILQFKTVSFPPLPVLSIKLHLEINICRKLDMF